MAIDEFPYLADGNKGISSIFQAGWDEYLKDTPIYLILCGSSIGMMEQETLAYKAPLYGRRTGQIFVRPLPFSEARKFFPHYNFEEALKAYCIAGGTPAYLLKLAAYSSIDEAIREEIFSTEKILYEEIEFILKEELREPRNYFSVLKAIGSNCTKVSEIINETGLEKSALHNYLFVLENLHLIEKQIPVTEKNPKASRKGRYYLKDQFFKFFYLCRLQVFCPGVYNFYGVTASMFPQIRGYIHQTQRGRRSFDSRVGRIKSTRFIFIVLHSFFARLRRYHRNWK